MEAVIILVFSIFLTGFIKERKEKGIIENIFYLSMLIFTFSAVMYIIQKQSFMLFVYDGLFRMFFSVFLLLIFFFLLIKSIEPIPSNIPKKLINKNGKFLFALPVMASFCALSNEFISITIVIAMLFYSITAWRLSRIKFIMGILCFIASLAGMFILIYMGTFTRKTGEVSILYYISELKSIFPFVIYYIKYVVINHSLAYSFLLIQYLIINKKIKNDEYSVSVQSIIKNFLIGNLIFFCLLIFLGETHYSGQYWIVHDDLHVMYSLMLFAYNLALFKVILKNQKINFILAGIVTIIVSIFLSVQNYIYYKNFMENIKILRVETYKAEKIIRLANLKNKTAYLDKSILKQPYLWGLFGVLDKKETDTLYLNSPYKDYLNGLKNSRQIRNGYIYTDEIRSKKNLT